jgi:hypothetical protein
MSVRRLRVGELLALAGAALVIVSLLKPHYEDAGVKLDAWDTFGPGVVLLIVAMIAALVLVLSALTEHSVALPVAAGVWCVALGLAGLIAAVVRLLERPDHATAVCAGAWLALAGAAAILVGGWQSLRDERPSMYTPARPDPRPRP